MDIINEIFALLLSITILDVLKVFIVIALVVYVVFASIVARQLHLKRKTVETTLGSFLEFLAIIHVLASLLLILFAVLVL